MRYTDLRPTRKCSSLQMSSLQRSSHIAIGAILLREQLFVKRECCFIKLGALLPKIQQLCKSKITVSIKQLYLLLIDNTLNS